MSPVPDGVELRRLTIPSSIDDPDAADFVEMARVRNLVYREIAGNDDDTMSPGELLPFYQPDEEETRLVWAVIDHGRFVGRIGVDIPHHPGSVSAWWVIELLREVWGRGLGSAAYELVERTCREHGRTVLQSGVVQRSRDGESVDSPTGYGRVPLDHTSRFYLAHGYALEQVARASALDLTGDPAPLHRLLRDAESASPAYRIVRWLAPTPAEYADGYAWMKSRMNTDAPTGGLTIDEEEWDAARVARDDARYLDAGRIRQVTAAQHIPTGELCAFNELTIGRDRAGTTHQEDTLVLAAHRGRRLGMRVKCEGLLSWRAAAPESTRVVTHNAEENRPMLDVNEAIGFAPIAYQGEWKKVLG